jgi:hypothetical protein
MVYVLSGRDMPDPVVRDFLASYGFADQCDAGSRPNYGLRKRENTAEFVGFIVMTSLVTELLPANVPLTIQTPPELVVLLVSSSMPVLTVMLPE